MLRAKRWAAATVVLLVGCASGGRSAPEPAEPRAEELPGQERVGAAWPLKTRPHVDLWLHGFAMVQDDTTQVPYFRRGYRERMATLRRQANVTTALETNRERLRARFAVNRDLIGAQFLALYFGSWEQMRQAIELFERADGDPRRSDNRQAQGVIGLLANVFPTSADREWLRLFSASLRDENDKFYYGYWQNEQRARVPILARLDSLWEYTYRPKLQPYLNNTQLTAGDFVLSLPLDGEGRTVTSGAESNTITTAFPEAHDTAIEAVYVFAHEAISPVASVAVTDNTTPSEQRQGTSDRYSSAALVRGGALLLKRTAPELVDGYARYYLESANARTTASDPLMALAQAFPLPDAIVGAIDRQLDIVLGGI